VLLLTAGGGISLLIMVGIDRAFQTLGARVATGAVLTVVLGGAFLSMFSGCIASPFAHLDPIVVTLWVNYVSEAVSLPRMLQLFPEKALGFYGFPILTAGLGVMALGRSPPAERFRWMAGLAPLVALIGVSFWQVRGAPGALMVAAPLFAASVTVLWPRLASARNLLLLSVAASPLSLAAIGIEAKPLTDAVFKPQAIDEPSLCRSVSDVASLATLPKGRVMAPIDLGPAILVETPHEVFAGPYHRNNDGNTALIKLMLAPAPAAKQILSDRHVDYVVTCAASPDRNIIRRAPDGLEAQLSRGEPPDFLKRVQLDPADKISVWRVRK